MVPAHKSEKDKLQPKICEVSGDYLPAGSADLQHYQYPALGNVKL